MALTPLRQPAPARPEAPPQPGFFGKLPMRGDFVTRRMEGRLRTIFDDWLSASIAASRRSLGEDWAEIYAHAPAWRFVLGPGVAGPDSVAGLLIASSDSFGRHFPLVIAVELPNCNQPLSLIRTAEAWFAAAERAAASGLAENGSLDVFDGRVLALGQPPFGNDRGSTARHFALGGEAADLRAYAGALEATLGVAPNDITVWWTRGGHGVTPALLHHRGLPEPDRFAALLDGHWETWGWSPDAIPPEEPGRAPVTVVGGGDAPDATLPNRLRSAARTHRGTRASSNQDAALERPELGLWAVADGAGGHDRGAYASAMVIDKLATFQAPLSFGSALTELEELLGDANEVLCAKGRQIGPDHLCAAVMVALFVHRGRYAVIWAGDSRAYLRREGRLVRLTRDHVAEGGRYVTRAIGAEAALAVDVSRGEVQPGDRFVLCSDGLVKTISDRMLETAAARGSAAEVATALIDDALISGAADNVTALVVDVGA